MIFVNLVNNFHPAIKFTCEFSFETKSVVFLDLLIWVDDQGFIQTDLHVKENAKNSYLLPVSNHPHHICKNIPYSLAFRVKRNCSQVVHCEQRYLELKEKLVGRGYKSKVVDNAVEKVRQLDRSTILQRVVRENRNRDRVKSCLYKCLI